MARAINVKELARQIKEKRGDRGLREVAKEIGGVTFSTLSRIERGNLPDLETFFLLCDWLGVDPKDLKISNSIEDKDTKEKIAVHLRADRNISQETTNALLRMFDLVIDAENKK